MQGKVVLVTGGSSGIGLAAAHKIAQGGAVTVIVGRDQDKLDAAKNEIDAALKEAGNRTAARSSRCRPISRATRAATR